MAAPLEVDVGAREWLDVVYAGFESGWLTLFSVDRNTGDRATDWFEIGNREAMATAARRRARTSDVWFGVATRRERVAGRGRATDCAELPGLWLDIDVAGPNHKATEGLPPTLEDAWKLLGAFPLPPTAVVASGGGLQAWWLFHEPLAADEATPLLMRWAATWSTKAAGLGWRVDNVFDLARVMRLPGTVNRKNVPRLVRVLEFDDDRRYNPSDLDEHTVAPPAPKPSDADRHVPYIGPERPGDAYNARHTGSQVLAEAGWTIGGIDRNGDESWLHPWSPTSRASATVYADDGRTVIWSDTVAARCPAIELRRPYDPFGLLAVLRYGGDWRLASDELAERGYGVKARPDEARIALDDFRVSTSAELLEVAQAADGEPTTWEPIDLAEILSADYEPARPALLTRADGQALLYPARTNVLMGESGSGKSWVALLAAAELLLTGGTVLYVDLEDHPRSIVDRLVALGVPVRRVIDGFVYVRPDRAAGPEALELIDRLVVEHAVGLVVIDSVGEAMALQGLKQNDDDEVARWFRRVAKRWAALSPAVVLIDHVPKDPDGPKLYAIGSQRKRAAVDGVQWRVDQVRPFAKGKPGALTLTCGKDRNGAFAQHHVAAEVAVEPNEDGSRVQMTVATPEGRDEATGKVLRPTFLMQRLSEWLEEEDGASGRELMKAVQGKTDYKRIALDLLVAEGFVAAEETTVRGGKGHRYTSIRPYRTLLDGLEDRPAPPAPLPAPQGKGARVSTPTENPRPPRPPTPLTGGAGARVRGADGPTEPSTEKATRAPVSDHSSEVTPSQPPAHDHAAAQSSPPDPTTLW